MTAFNLPTKLAAVIIAVGLAAPAVAQPYMVYPAQNGLMINRPGDGQTGGYGQRTDPGTMIFVPNVPAQPPPQQANPSQQNWQQYMPAQRYNR